MNLTLHFSLEELIRSDVALRKGIDNTPSAEQIEKLRVLAQHLEEVRAIVGPLYINSGYRSPALNAAVGSVPSSQHVLCEAADVISLDGYTPIQMCRMVRDNGILYDQLIHEFGAWMHISFGSRSRKQLLTINANGTVDGLWA